MSPVSPDSLSPAKRALYEIRSLREKVERLESSRTEPIAVVGIGLRFPGGAVDAESYWDLLAGGVDAVTEVPPDRWPAQRYFDPDPKAPGKMYTRHGGFLADVAGFDAEFFGISPREAASMDPQHRLALEVAWEALENAGQNPGQLGGSATGVFLALSNSDYGRRVLARTTEIDTYASTGNNFSTAAGRISYTLGLQGPSLVVDTACSGSLVAVHLASASLRSGECRMALVGGVNLILSPEIHINFSKARMLAPDGKCKTFDAAADGYVRGEGGGMVVLKRLSDALADGDRILAMVRGTAVNQDGRSGGLTVPSNMAQQAVIRQALANAGVQPAAIQYVEAHGTGTALGDPIETNALAAVLGEGRATGEPLVLGSVKTNLGHLEAAAGMAGLIKVILALEHESIPAHLHFRALNPQIDWGGVPVQIPVAPVRWPRGEKARLAGVSSFGFSGTNAHVIVEEGPQPAAATPEIERPYHVLAISARSGQALRELTRRYAASLERSAAGLGDFCATANTGRAHFQCRALYVGRTREEMRSALGNGPGAAGETETPPSVIFLFPGQGALYAGAGRQLWETQPDFRRALEECADLMRPHMEHAIVDVLYGRLTDRLDQTAYAQPTLFALEYALAQLWMSWGIRPAAVLGHSIGEFAAATLAGLWSLADGVRMVAERGRLMQAAGGKGSMVAVMASEERVQSAIEGYAAVSIAAVNAPDETVVSGDEEAVRAVAERLAREGVTVKPLAVTHAFHSAQMDGATAAFRRVAAEARYRTPELTIISSLTGRVAEPGELMHPDYWSRQLRETVRFREAAAAAREYDAWIEAGPGTTLVGLGQRSVPGECKLWLPSLRRSRDDWAQMVDSLGRVYAAGADVDWAGFEKPYRHNRAVLPTYPFEHRRHWIEAAPAAGDAGNENDGAFSREAALRQSRQCAMDLQVHTYADRWRALDELSLAYIVETLRGFGVFGRSGERHTVSTLLRRLGIGEGFGRLLGRWLARLEQAGLLQQEDDSFVAPEPLPSYETATLVANARALFGADRAFLDYVIRCGERLRGVLSGTISPLETLFPGGDFAQAEELYERAPLSRYFTSIARSAVEGVLRSRGAAPLQLLEIGAGTGATSSAVLPALEHTGSTYTFTDVSPWFLDRAARKFAGVPFVRYGLLDIEKAIDPQAYSPGSFDVVLATNVLHATRDIVATLRQVQTLLAPGGLLVLSEATTYLSWFDITTALVEGWQSFGDVWRRDHPLLSAGQWRKALQEAGFEECAVAPEEGSPAEVLGQHVLLAQVSRQKERAEPAVVASVASQSSQGSREPVAKSTIRQDEDLTAFIRRQIAELLRMDEPDAISRRRKLIDLGLDSLMAVELRDRIAHGLELSDPLPATLVFDHPTVDAITEYLHCHVLHLDPAASESRADALSGRAVEIEQLEDEEVEALLRARLETL